MSFKHLSLVGLSAMLTTCLPSPEPHTGKHLKVLTDKVNDNSQLRILVKKCDYQINGWQLDLDHERILEHRPGTFPFDTTLNLTFEGVHQLIVTNWDSGGNIERDTITINNSL